MSLHKLPRGLLEIPKGTNTSCTDNSTFTNNLERTNALLAQFVSTTDINKKLIMRQELEESYFNLTMYNLKESVKHKIEQDMWNNLFKKYISDLQTKIKSKDKSEFSRAQSEMSIFLDEAVGFYSKFIDTLSLVYNIRLPGREVDLKISLKKSRNLDEASEEDIRYIIQHCFVHMGDLSRYHNLSKQARFYYEMAVEINPSSGHAYNQLAILESSSVVHSSISNSNYQHIIRTILMYEYANSCEIPFPATRINLESLLRHVNEQSVSTLLTSNNSINDQNCLYSISIAWIHSYSSSRMCSNIQRCRQLQQRIIDWASELVKYVSVCRKYWHDLTAIAGLQCLLMSIYTSQTEYVENKLWSSNVNQFSQDFLNAICRGLVSLSHENKLLDELLTNPGCISIVVIFMLWIHQYLDVKPDSASSTPPQLPLKVPFGEDFVKFVNIINGMVKTDQIEHVAIPFQLPELDFLTGFQPLKVPCKSFDIYSTQKPTSVDEHINANSLNIRISFIVSVCHQMFKKYPSLLTFDVTEQRFSPVTPPEPQPTKKYVKIEPSILNKKPVNVALASMKINNTKPNGIISQNVPSKVSFEIPTSDLTKGITDVKIAKCIQEHIAQDTKSIVQLDTFSTANNSICTRDDSHIIAPAPGLILSSNLPPEYKSMSSAIPATEQTTNSSSQISDQSLQNDQLDHKTLQNNLKNHSYNPNREQFEKDLPPRFANKRSFSQETTTVGSSVEPGRNYFDQNKGVFTSMTYWDSINDFQSTNQFDNNNLTKKESEILLPPTVPTAWLTEESQDHISGLKTESNINNPLMHFPYGNNLMHNQQSQQHTFSGMSNQQSPQNNHMTMAPQQSFNQFNQNQPVHPDQDNQLQYLLQSVTTNANSPRFRTQTDVLSMQQMSFMHQSPGSIRMPPKFPPSIPPPTLSQQPQQPQSANYEPFQMTRSNFYDKPVFSTSNNQSAFGNYSPSQGGQPGSIMAQQQQSMQQQQQQQQQVRHNNPLLNLLPGFMGVNNEGNSSRYDSR